MFLLRMELPYTSGSADLSSLISDIYTTRTARRISKVRIHMARCHPCS